MIKNLLDLQCNIHTLGARCEDYREGNYAGIERMKNDIDHDSGLVRYTLRINPNTFAGREILSLNELEDVLNEIIRTIGASNFQLTRLDLKLDSFGLDDHNKNLKLNRLIVLLVGQENNLHNRYESHDPLTLVHKTTIAKSAYYEIENYDKSLESGGKVAATNRLELRAKALLKKNKTILEVIEIWIRKLDHIASGYKALQESCNAILLSQWNEEKHGTVKTMGEFLRKYQHNIFTCDQLAELYRQMGHKSPRNAAYKFKSDSGIEYISNKQLQAHLKTIKETIGQFIPQMGKMAKDKSEQNSMKATEKQAERENENDPIYKKRERI